MFALKPPRFATHPCLKITQKPIRLLARAPLDLLQNKFPYPAKGRGKRQPPEFSQKIFGLLTQG
jgi:hypothetical protein